MPGIDVSVFPPRTTGLNAASGVRVLEMEKAAVLEVRTGVTSRARGAGGGRLQANELATAIRSR